MARPLDKYLTTPVLDIVDGITVEFWAIVKGGEAIQSGVEKGVAWVSGFVQSRCAL